jgi:ABC-2 type transport system permease protein
LGSFCFSSLGVLLSSPNVQNPSYIMMLSTLIRFPLIFISGIFLPLSQLKGVPRFLANFSPLTYLVDLMGFSLRGDIILSPLIDAGMLLGFGVLFALLAYVIHVWNLKRGI